MQPRVLILGAGGHGQSVAEAFALQGGAAVVGFIDDGVAAGSMVFGLPVLGNMGSLPAHAAVANAVCVAIGNNATRQRLTAQAVQAGFALATVVHPRAFVAPSAVVGAGSAIMAGALLGTCAQLGQGAIVNCGAVVDHHAVVEDFGHLGVGAVMAGGSRLGQGAWLQAGCALGYGVVVPAGQTLPLGTALGGR
ncbi:MAG: acetyltransferase [Burkholderiaceae bacterium]|nr:acetyltransferase [Burkholderiaceae bacterium]